MWIAKLLSLMKVSLSRPSTVLAPWPLSHCFGVLVKVAPCSSLYISEDKLDYVAVIPPQISVAYDHKFISSYVTCLLHISEGSLCCAHLGLMLRNSHQLSIFNDCERRK